MAVAAAGTGTRSMPWAARRRRVAELRRARPFAREVLDLYGALLPVQQTCSLEAADNRPAPGRLAAYVAELVVPRVLDVTLAAGPEKLRGGLLELLERRPAVEVVEGWIGGAEQSPVERYLARACLGPVLEGVGEAATHVCSGPRDARHCPACGGPPQLAYFAPATDDLAAGPRRLLCARCGGGWGYARMTCPGCGEDSSSKLPIFSEEGTASGERGNVVRGLPGPSREHAAATFPSMRIEACESCRRYLLSVDVAADAKAVPEVDELTGIPLDLYAREKGFTKIIPNLMGF